MTESRYVGRDLQYNTEVEKQERFMRQRVLCRKTGNKTQHSCMCVSA